MSEQIKFFGPKDNFYELSNYYMMPFELNNITYNSVEQYYQAQKFYKEDSMNYFYLMLEADSPQKVKDLGNQRKNYRGDKWLINKNKPELGLLNETIDKFKNYKMRDDWEEVKENVMYEGLKAKFKNEYLKNLLLTTKDKILIENSPYDKFWGIGSDGTGKNILGKMLMKLREEIV